MSKEIVEYIEKRAVKGPWKIELDNLARLKQIVVVPAYDELEYIPHLLNSLSKNEKKYCEETLVIIVVNNKKKGITKEEIICRNQETLQFLREVQRNKLFPFHIGIVDASSPGYEIPESAGVGLVRKIGLDLGLKVLLECDKLNGGLICLDADCKVSDNYLKEWNRFFKNHPRTAGVMAFAHPIDDTEVGIAITYYEIFIRLYELCLFTANSPYSFIPIGSTIGVDSALYASVGGMSTKSAGEDFYFLQKIAKIGEIRKITKAQVYPSSRISDRVIFGTGPKIKEYITFPNKRDKFYNLLSFEVLKEWVRMLDNPLDTPQLMLEKSKEISVELYNFLKNNKWIEKTQTIYKETKDKFYLVWRLHEWFDGLKTLRLIHWLKERSFPDTNLIDTGKKLLTNILGINIHEEYTAKELLEQLRLNWNYNERDGVGIKPHLYNINM